MNEVLPPLATLMPHAGPMLLLDRLISVDDESLQAEVTIRRERLFCAPDGVGAWVGIEYMAQAAAAFAGYQAMSSGQAGPAEQARPAPRPGFLLGTRSYTSSLDRYTPGSVLRIVARPMGQGGNGLTLFDCSISLGADDIARATISVFQASAQAAEGLS